MSILRSLLAGFSSSSKETYGISYAILSKGFQIFNPDLYAIMPNPARDNIHLNTLIVAYDHNGSIVSKHLRDQANTTVTTLNQCARDDGAFCSYIEYNHRKKSERDAETAEQASFLLGVIDTDDDGKLVIENHVAISGYISNDPRNKEAYFICEEIRCLGELNGKPTLFAPETNYDITGMFTYANQAFLQFVAGLFIDKNENQKWAQIDDPKTLEQAADICRSMRARTVQSLEQDIDNIIRQTTSSLAKKALDRHPS
ncbi:MAG TPA: hypothetical protein PKI93_05895 [Alphaproteobacteria bacterium]|nr:hypothetical protein [Alphaproteobacteria bacterium]HNS44743.1 hypothetical protein [Alphaproteobacteria bacterium]